MPAATVTGNEWLMPYIGIATTSWAAATISGGTPSASLPNTITQSSGSSARHRSAVATSFSNTTSFQPSSRARARKAASSGSSTMCS